MLAIGAFLGLALEAVHAFGWEPIVYGKISFNEYSTMQTVIHWLITCLTWGGVAYLLIRVAKDKLGFDLFISSKKLKYWQIAAIFFGIALSIAMSYLDWNGFKFIKEFHSKDLIIFIFQYIYYMVETAMFLLIIVFGQKALEIWTKKYNVPWGGIVCAFTWGIAHLVSRGNSLDFDLSNGIAATIGGFMFGTAYLLANRDIKKSWLILFLMFAL